MDTERYVPLFFSISQMNKFISTPYYFTHCEDFIILRNVIKIYKVKESETFKVCKK